MIGGAENEKSLFTGRTLVLASVTCRATSSGSFPGFGLRCSQSLFELFRFLCLCLVTFGAVVSNTSKDFERLVSCSWLRVFQVLVRELGLLYV